MGEFRRPQEGFRFEWGGVNTKEAPDALPQGKYQAAQNVRATAERSIRTRPGYEILFSCNNAAVTDIRAYATLNNNSFPRFLARDANGNVFLDTGDNVGNLSGNAAFGVSMIPFRPSESPNTWMYIGSAGDYQKFSAPDANNNVTKYKVGIAEPQQTLQAAPTFLGFAAIAPNAGNWNFAGTASAGSGSVRSTDNLGACVVDPALATRYYCQVGNNANAGYSRGQIVQVGAAFVPVQEVLPSLGGNTGSNITIQSIHYASGSTGNCVIVPSQIPGQTGAIASIQRGSLVTVGNETVPVLGLIPGPNGLLAFETSSNGTFTAGTTIKGVPAIAIDGAGFAFTPGAGANSTYISANMNAGIGTISQPLATNPFTTVILSNVFPQQDDYVHISVGLSDPTQLIQLLILFTTEPGGNNFNGNVFYYAVRPGDLVGLQNGNTTLLPAILQAAENEIIGQLPTAQPIPPPDQTVAGNNQWGEVFFPVSALTNLGGDSIRTIADCTGVQLQINVANNCIFNFSSFWVGGGGQPDIGQDGEPYRYQAVPLSSLTGVRGNPTPPMRYGVSPRRQAVIVNTGNLNASYDPQIDTWEVYRLGGSVTSTRFLGTTPVGSNFTDVYFDDSVAAGGAIPIDNTEPWPSIDVPFSLVNGNAGTIVAFGNILYISAPANTYPATITRWLPGTIFQIGGKDAFTLRERPVANNSTDYYFHFEECIGSGVQSSVFVLEPNVARQPLPYLWGPNEEGYVFGCGDPLRPGTVSWCKAYGPDAAPTAFTLELCPPSEPLLGGEVIRGVSLVASSKRWWYLNFQSGNEQQLYVQVEAPVGKRIASPYAHTSDGVSVYFWAEDCIAETDGGAATDLTGPDLYNLFPHAGIAGGDVVSCGITFYAPDYSRAAQFRMTFRSGLLLAFYFDHNGISRTLVYDKARKAWSTDVYADQIRVAYSIEQPQASFQSAGNRYPGIVLGDANGNVWMVKDLTNDGVVPIRCGIATREYNGGDARTSDYWGDVFLDVLAPAGMNATPITLGQPVAGTTAIAANNARQFIPVSVGGETLQSFLGLNCSWSDDFRTQTVPTTLYVWQPSYTDKPEIIRDRFGDWMDFGVASYVRGMTMYADTFGANKGLLIRNADNNQTYPMQGGVSPGVINHNGEQTISYWFNPPFVAHMVREEPQDLVPWRKFKIEYLKDEWPELTDLASPWMKIRDTGQAGFLQGLILPLEVGANNNNVAPNLKLRTDANNTLITLRPTVNPQFNVKTGVPYSLDTPVVCHQVQIVPQEPCRVWWTQIEWKAQATPELAETWITQFTGFGIKGYKHIPRVEVAYSAAAQVTLTIESFDGKSPQVLTLGSTGGVYQRYLRTLTFNKGQLYRFSAVSESPFQIFYEDFTVWVCEWGRQGLGVPVHLGAEFGDQMPI